MGNLEINDEKMLGYVKVLCIGQFIVLLILTYVFPSLDRKFVLFVSAATGVLAYGAASRNYIRGKVDAATKPLSDDFYKTGTITENEQSQDNASS